MFSWPAKKKSIRDGEMCKINQESITLLEGLSEPFHSYCVQAMLLLCSKCRTIKIRGMDTDKWVDRHPFSVSAAASVWPAGGGKGLLIVCFSSTSTAGRATLKAWSALECFLRVFQQNQSSWLVLLMWKIRKWNNCKSVVCVHPNQMNARKMQLWVEAEVVQA